MRNSPVHAKKWPWYFPTNGRRRQRGCPRGHPVDTHRRAGLEWCRPDSVLMSYIRDRLLDDYHNDALSNEFGQKSAHETLSSESVWSCIMTLEGIQRPATDHLSDKYTSVSTYFALNEAAPVRRPRRPDAWVQCRLNRKPIFMCLQALWCLLRDQWQKPKPESSEDKLAFTRILKQ